jgi:preprotein translocase subunit YajC
MSIRTVGIETPEAGIPFLAAMAAPGQGGSPVGALFVAATILAIFYFIVLRPMKRQQQKVAEFRDALKIGDKIVTSGGLYGQITKVSDQSVQLQVADKVRVEVARNAVVGYQGEEPVVPAEAAGGSR